jgi:hypothetical protein
MLVPEKVEGVVDGLGAAEKHISELRLSLRVDAHDFPIQHTTATSQVTSPSFATIGEGLECVSISRDQPHALLVRMQQCSEPIPFNLEDPV